MKKKIMSVLLILVICCSSLLTACGSSSSGDEADPGTSPETDSASLEDGVTLTFWSNDGSTQWMEVWQNAADAYMAEHSDVKIELTGISWDDAATKFNTAATTDSLPDMAFLAPSIVSPMLGLDVLVDLTPYYEAYSGKDNINSAYIDYYKNFSPVKTGMWSAPMFASDNQIWYRKDYFDAAGIEFPETWDEWYDAIDTLTTDDYYGYSFRGGAGGWNLAFYYLLNYTNAESFFDADGKCFLRNEKSVEALTRYIDIYLDGKAPESAISNGYTEMIAEFSNGNTAMVWHHLQSKPLIEEYLDMDILGYGNIPKNSEGERVKMDEPQGICIFTSCDEEKRQAAWDFIEFLWTPEQQHAIIETAGAIPANTETEVSDILFVEDAIAQASDPATRLVSAPYYLPNWSSFTSETVTPDLQALLLETMTPEEAINGWADKLETMYAEYFAQQ